MTADDAEPGRLIILGGGIAALTTAFYASETNWHEVFPGGIHVYEQNAYLGGKGASLRKTTGDVANRIEEHGLHVWFGFYDNAFALLSKCHDELEQRAEGGYERLSSSLRNIEDGFRACSRVGVMDYDGADWLRWVADFPEDATRPWDKRAPEAGYGTPGLLAVRALQLVEAFLYSLTGLAASGGRAPTTLIDASILPIPIRLPTSGWVADALKMFVDVGRANAPTAGLELLSKVLRLVAMAARELRYRLDETVRRHNGFRRIFTLVDLMLAAVRGLIDDGVIASSSFDLIDHWDLREWLLLHGATEESVSAGLLKALVYDLAFAYEDGDPDKPACSAATGVYGLLRLLLTYRGAVMWKMNAGMGEIVFAPIYEALKAREVVFHFGHKVKQVELDASWAKRIVFDEMPKVEGEPIATLEIESGPLAGTLAYWKPPEPGAPAIPEAITLGPHDMVVYAMPVGTIDIVMPDAPGSWKTCAARVKTTATAALQLWLKAGVEQYAPGSSRDITVGAYTEPFDTWSDMQTLAGERGKTSAIASVAYFTNVAPDGADQAQVEAKAAQFVSTGLADLWPNFVEKSMVIDRYARANVDASSRYSLSLPGTMAARLSPRDSSIRNVRPVGDWTRNRISAGCIEAAVISGMLAAQVLRPDRPLDIFGENT